MTSIPQLTRGVLAALLPAMLLGAAPNARAFEVHRHAKMTYQVLHRQGLGAIAAGLVAYGAMLPDVEDCLPPNCYCDYVPGFCRPDSMGAVPFAVDHFDNNLLDESIFRVNDRMAQARAGVVPSPTNPRASALALIAFGKALHTTQDFYAHSTWLEINIFSIVFQFDLTNAPIWFGEPYALYAWRHGSLTGDGSLQTGFYLQGAPAGGYTHGQLNKDAPGSSEGGQPLVILGHGSSTMYGAVSGDFAGNMTFDDAGLAPQHTIYAYNLLRNPNGGDVFPYVFGPRAAVRPVDPVAAKQVQEFFAWVETDPTMIALSVAADSIVEHAWGDSLDKFPINAIDADGLPLPLTTGAGAPTQDLPRLLGAAHPNPFSRRTEISFLAPRAGPVRMIVFDVEGRRIATLVNGAVGAGLHEVDWDGATDAGSAAPAGVYLVRFSGFGRSEAGRIALAR